MNSRVLSILTLVFALAYFFLKDILFTFLGIGRDVQSVQDFEYDCHRIRHPLLESCEDLWLDESQRILYAACTDLKGRREWVPGANRFNVSGRSGLDHIAVLDIDKPGIDGLYGLRQLELSDTYHGAGDEHSIDLHGFAVHEVNENLLRFWLINHRPPVDSRSGQVLKDATTLGANSTIEIFELSRDSSEMTFIKTIASEHLIAPNNIAAFSDGTALVTNDHSSKVGTFRPLEPFFGTGTIAYCQLESAKCSTAASQGLSFPNGVVKGFDGLYYVSHFVTGKITVHSLESKGKLSLVHEIKLGMPLDNLSIDSHGNIFAAGFPKVAEVFKGFSSSEAQGVPSTIFKIQAVPVPGSVSDFKYEITKILEDRDGSILPSTTTAVHDVKTRRLFLGGVVSPFITVCERR